MCDHIGVVKSWTVDDKTRLVPAMFGCTQCDWSSVDMPVADDPEMFHDHDEYVDGCFACKIATLQLQTGDANGNMVRFGWTNKKWDSELKAYKDARAQGIQPKSTKMKDIQAAVAASDKAGKAFVAS